MNKYLIKLANHLDKKGLHKEADYIGWIIKQAALLTDSNFHGFDKSHGWTLINEKERTNFEINIDGNSKKISLTSLFYDDEDSSRGELIYKVSDDESTEDHIWSFNSGFHPDDAAWRILLDLGVIDDNNQRDELREEMAGWLNTQVVYESNLSKEDEERIDNWFSSMKRKMQKK